MRYRLLGRSGLRVSEAALGTMTFGEDWGWGASEDECRRIFERYAEAGGNFVDTANNYTDGSSERIVGGLVAAERERFVVATKYTLTTRPDDPNAGGNHRKNLVQSLEASLRRLGTDYVDLLWLHMRDGITPIDEIVRALDDQVRLGKVLYVGISDSPAWLVAQANTLADLRGWSPFVAVQLPYSVSDRTRSVTSSPWPPRSASPSRRGGSSAPASSPASRRRSGAGRRTASRSEPRTSSPSSATSPRSTTARRPRLRSPGSSPGRHRRL